MKFIQTKESITYFSSQLCKVISEPLELSLFFTFSFSNAHSTNKL
ncbi:hypothetical protein D354_00698 [Enterococcus faecalis]|nr:hypothetical protein D354_00698 [Enterococcus faecalis]